MTGPRLPASAMKTYEINAPLSTHFRPATCEEMDCPAYVHGWSTTVDESTELGQGQAYYIRNESRRRYSEIRGLSPTDRRTTFRFEPGQRCFKSDEHRTRIERPEIYVVRDGDARGNPRRTATRRHASAADWQEDFAEHQQTLSDRAKEG